LIQFFKSLFSKNKRKEFKVARHSSHEKHKIVFVAIVFIISMLLSFYAGEYWTSEVAYQRDALQIENEKIAELLEQEKIKLASANLNAEIAQVAIEKVREKNSELLLQISDLERDVSYYQRVMNPIRNDKGLRIDTLEVEPTSDANRFRLNLVLTQLGKKNSSIIQGVLELSIEGSEQGLKKVYRLEELALANPSITPKFQFRYFQELSEEFVLPQGFVAERINVRAISSGAKSMTVEKTKDWKF